MNDTEEKDKAVVGCLTLVIELILFVLLFALTTLVVWWSWSVCGLDSATGVSLSYVNAWGLGVVALLLNLTGNVTLGVGK